MSEPDNYLALFGGARSAADEDPARPARSDAPRLGTVLASLEGQYLLELPDGSRVVVEVYERLDVGATVPVFPLEDRWALSDPRWPLAGAALVRGQKVMFLAEKVAVRGADRPEEGLLGRVQDREAWLAKDQLQWPLCAWDHDLTSMVGQFLRCKVVDPRDGATIELSCREVAEVDPSNLPRLYALATLATLAPKVLVRVTGPGPPLRVELFGASYMVYEESADWRGVVRKRGERLCARLSVHLPAGHIQLSLRSAEQPEWAEVKRRYPIGSVLEGVTSVARTARGTWLCTADPDLRVTAFLKTSAFAPDGWWKSAERGPWSVPLRVVAHDETSCDLVVDLEPYVTRRWRTVQPGTFLLVGAGGDGRALWDVGCRVATTAPLKEQFEWAKVVEADPAARHLVARPVGPTRMAVAAGSEVVFPDGLRATVSNRDALPDEGAACETWVKASKFGGPALLPVVVVVDPVLEAMLVEADRRRAEQLPIRCSVARKLKDGLEVHIRAADLGVTLPGSEQRTLSAYLHSAGLSTEEAQTRGPWVGRTLEVFCTRCSRDRLSVSQKLPTPRVRQATEGGEPIVLDAVLRGRVSGIAQYGVFVDLGGSSGLIHRSQIELANASLETFALNDEIEVRVFATDGNGSRISLTLPVVSLDEAVRHTPPVKPVVRHEAPKAESLWTLSSDLGICKRDILDLYRAALVGEPPEWRAPLPPETAQALREAHRRNAPLRTGLAPPPLVEAAPPRAPAPERAPERIAEEPVSADVVVPGFEGLLRLQKQSGWATAEPPVEASDDEVIARLWMLFVGGEITLANITDALHRAGLARVASLFDGGTPAMPPEAFVLGALAPLVGAPPPDEGGRWVHALDVILGALGSAPNEPLGWTLLRRAVPEDWWLASAERIERWVRRVSTARGERPGLPPGSPPMSAPWRDRVRLWQTSPSSPLDRGELALLRVDAPLLVALVVGGAAGEPPGPSVHPPARPREAWFDAVGPAFHTTSDPAELLADVSRRLRRTVGPARIAAAAVCWNATNGALSVAEAGDVKVYAVRTRAQPVPLIPGVDPAGSPPDRLGTEHPSLRTAAVDKVASLEAIAVITGGARARLAPRGTLPATVEQWSLDGPHEDDATVLVIRSP